MNELAKIASMACGTASPAKSASVLGADAEHRQDIPLHRQPADEVEGDEHR